MRGACSSPTGQLPASPTLPPTLPHLLRKTTSVDLKLEKTPEFGLPVTTRPNKQRQELNLYGRSIQMAGDLRKWQIHTLTDHLVISFQAKFL